jgi:hypothetical protein
MYYLCWLVWRQDETGDGDTVGWWLLVAVDGPDGFVTPAHGKIIHTIYLWVKTSAEVYIGASTMCVCVVHVDTLIFLASHQTASTLHLLYSS